VSLEDLRTELWRLPADERCAMLILSVTELDQDALAAVLNIIGVAEKRVSVSRRIIRACWREGIA
jgi:hypothetical protein